MYDIVAVVTSRQGCSATAPWRDVTRDQPIRDAIDIYPWPTPVATATKFGTKWTRFILEICPRS